MAALPTYAVMFFSRRANCVWWLAEAMQRRIPPTLRALSIRTHAPGVQKISAAVLLRRFRRITRLAGAFLNPFVIAAPGDRPVARGPSYRGGGTVPGPRRVPRCGEAAAKIRIGTAGPGARFAGRGRSRRGGRTMCQSIGIEARFARRRLVIGLSSAALRDQRKHRRFNARSARGIAVRRCGQTSALHGGDRHAEARVPFVRCCRGRPRGGLAGSRPYRAQRKRPETPAGQAVPRRIDQRHQHGCRSRIPAHRVAASPSRSTRTNAGPAGLRVRLRPDSTMRQ